MKERDNGDIYTISAGSAVTDVKIISGLGSWNNDTQSENPLDKSKFCVQHHGGKVEEWFKAHGITTVQGHGEQGKVLVSWYENPAIGSVGRTIKGWYENTVEDYYADNAYYERCAIVKGYDENDKNTWGRLLPGSHPDIIAAKEAARARGKAKRKQREKEQIESVINKLYED